MIASESAAVGCTSEPSDEGGPAFPVTYNPEIHMITQQQNVKTAIPDLRDLPLDMLAELGGRLSRTLLLFTGNDSKKWRTAQFL
jgi:hypothetical protein